MNDVLEQKRDQNLGRILLRLERRFTAQALSALDDKGIHGLKMSQMPVLGHIRTDGTRAVDIAKAVGISKQAVGKIIDEVKSAGYVETVPDPKDSRANIIRFTPAGQTLLAHALQETRKLEKRWARQAGMDNLDDLKQQLMTLLETCEESEKAD